MARSMRTAQLLLFSRTLNTSQLSYFNRNSRSIETLAFEEIQTTPDKPHTATAFVLHGLLGSGRNWRSFTRTLLSHISNSPPSIDWRVVLVDLRNHGRSADINGLDPPHDMVNAAKDLATLVKSQGWDWPDVVMGHSMGGQGCIAVCAKLCSWRIWRICCVAETEQLWVLDSVPGEVDPEDSDGEVEKVLQTLQGLPSLIPSRKWLVDHMMNLGFSKSLSQWIGSNLKKSGDHETWAFNLDGAVDMFNSYRETNYWSLLEDPPEKLRVAVVRAEKSDRWSPSVVQQLENVTAKTAGKVAVHVLPNSGHWVHVDNPRGLVDIIAPNMKIVS